MRVKLFQIAPEKDRYNPVSYTHLVSGSYESDSEKCFLPVFAAAKRFLDLSSSVWRAA